MCRKEVAIGKDQDTKEDSRVCDFRVLLLSEKKVVELLAFDKLRKVRLKNLLISTRDALELVKIRGGLCTFACLENFRKVQPLNCCQISESLY